MILLSTVLSIAGSEDLNGELVSLGNNVNEHCSIWCDYI